MARRAKVRLDGDGVPVSGRLHSCSICKKQDQWGEEWSWFGSYRDIDDGDPILKFCSAACSAQKEAFERGQALGNDIERVRTEKEKLERTIAYLQGQLNQISSPEPPHD